MNIGSGARVVAARRIVAAGLIGQATVLAFDIATVEPDTAASITQDKLVGIVLYLVTASLCLLARPDAPALTIARRVLLGVCLVFAVSTFPTAISDLSRNTTSARDVVRTIVLLVFGSATIVGSALWIATETARRGRLRATRHQA